MSVISLSVNATPIVFDDMGDANAYVFSDYSGFNSDSQGKLFVGGNATFNGYTVAGLNDWNSLALTVGGDLMQIGGDIVGLASIGGNSMISSAAPIRSTSDQRNFNQGYFKQLSTELSLMQSGNVELKWGALNLSGNLVNNTLFVDVNQQIWDSAWGFLTKGLAQGSRVVLNVSGESVSMNSSKDWLFKDAAYAFNHSSSNVLFNFYEAKSIDIGGGIYGSILAPNADINGNSGVLTGQVIANSFSGSTQLNFSPFETDEPPTSVSEPAVPALFALAALLMFRRQKRRQTKC